MSKELGPLPAPKGEGKDGPKEINYDNDHIALDPIPPRIAPQPEITYFYNKVTKYLNGSKVEFNTTPGHEYINIQHGNDKTRLTFFENGDVEIIQEDGNRHDEVSKDYDIEVGKNHERKVKGLTDDKQDSYFNTSKRLTYFSARQSFEVLSQKVLLRGRRGIELIGDVIIRGNMKIDGNLKVNGAFDANYSSQINDAYLDKKDDPNDQEDEVNVEPLTTGTTVLGPAGSTATSSGGSSGTLGGPTE